MISHNLLLTAEKQLQWISEELPPPGPQDILIQTKTGAISIGSELPLYRSIARAHHPAYYPRMTGYESIGTVLASGSDVKNIQPGDRVVAFYGHRTHAIIHASKAIVVPDDISDALAILTILSCDAAKGVRKLSPLPEEHTLITGAGAMGLLTLFILKAYGIQTVDVIEPQLERHRFAYTLGANKVLLPHDLSSSSEAYTIGFECSSRNEAFNLLQHQMRKNGRLCITADGNIEPLTLAPTFHEKELQIVGTSDGWDYHKHAAWYFQYMKQHLVPLEQLFEAQIARDELIEMLERLAQGDTRPIKVMIQY